MKKSFLILWSALLLLLCSAGCEKTEVEPIQHETKITDRFAGRWSPAYNVSGDENILTDPIIVTVKNKSAVNMSVSIFSGIEAICIDDSTASVPEQYINDNMFYVKEGFVWLLKSEETGLDILATELYISDKKKTFYFLYFAYDQHALF